MLNTIKTQIATMKDRYEVFSKENLNIYIDEIFDLTSKTTYLSININSFIINNIINCNIFITFNKFKHQKVSGVIKGLCDPWVFWLPINLIGDFAVPISLSLRLFANVLSGTVMMALYYGLLPIFVKIGIPAVLHIYFDLFSGAIQTYVFCMLTMTYVSDAVGEEVKA